MGLRTIVEGLNLDEALKKVDCVTYGKINLMRKADTTNVFIPAIVICGALEGPTFLVQAGLHGNEYEGCEAILQMVEKVDTKRLRGRIIAIPALNLEAFMSGNRGAFQDVFGTNDMNRVYPGRENGFFSQWMAHYHLNQIASKADFIVDLHGGGNQLYLQPEVIVISGDDDQAESRMRMGKAFGADAIWYDMPGKFNGANECFDTLAMQMRIPCIVVECGSQSSAHGFRRSNVDLIERGIFNIMKLYHMIDGEPEVNENCRVIDIEYLHCQNGGIHRLEQPPQKLVKEGTVLSTIMDVFGNVVEEIKAPYDGMIAGYWSYSLIYPRSQSIIFGKLVEETKK